MSHEKKKYHLIIETTPKDGLFKLWEERMFGIHAALKGLGFFGYAVFAVVSFQEPKHTRRFEYMGDSLERVREALDGLIVELDQFTADPSEYRILYTRGIKV